MVNIFIKKYGYFLITLFFCFFIKSTYTMMANPWVTGIFHFCVGDNLPILFPNDRYIMKMDEKSADLFLKWLIIKSFILANTFLYLYSYFMLGTGIVAKKIGLAKNHHKKYLCMLFFVLNHNVIFSYYYYKIEYKKRILEEKEPL